VAKPVTDGAAIICPPYQRWSGIAASDLIVTVAKAGTVVVTREVTRRIEKISNWTKTGSSRSDPLSPLNVTVMEFETDERLTTVMVVFQTPPTAD